MLAVLAEIDCLENLQSRGIYPDEYFTDFEAFKNKSVSYRDCTVVIIIAGTCQFSRRHIIEFIKTLFKRQENKQDTGIVGVIVLSDTLLPNIEKYYKFEDSFENFQLYSGKKCRGNAPNVWALIDEYQTKERHTVYSRLSEFDTGNIERILKKPSEKSSSEDALVRLIKVPDVKAIVNGK